MAEVFVPGEPVLFMGRGEGEWKRRVGEAHPRRLTRPKLRFVVGSFLRRGHRFDIDNLAKPVLDVAASLEAVSVWVTVQQGDEPGVWLSEAEPPPPPATAFMAAIAKPPTKSVRRVQPPPELAGVGVIGTGPLAVRLEYGDPEARLANLGFEGPVKPLIDSLWPVLGGGPTQPDDHRIRHLETLRGNVTGARIWIWPLTVPDQAH